MSWHYEPKKRGRPSVKEIPEQEKSTKFIRTYEDEFTIETWKYDLKKFSRGPIETEIKYKPGAEKALKQQIKETKERKRIERQMKKIEKNGASQNKLRRRVRSNAD